MAAASRAPAPPKPCRLLPLLRQYCPCLRMIYTESRPPHLRQILGVNSPQPALLGIPNVRPLGGACAHALPACGSASTSWDNVLRPVLLQGLQTRHYTRILGVSLEDGQRCGGTAAAHMLCACACAHLPPAPPAEAPVPGRRRSLFLHRCCQEQLRRRGCAAAGRSQRERRSTLPAATPGPAAGAAARCRPTQASAVGRPPRPKTLASLPARGPLWGSAQPSCPAV